MRTGGPVVRAIACVFLLALLATVPVLPAAAHTGTIRPTGTTLDETFTLPANNWTAYETELRAQGRLTYDVRVVSGTGIDPFILASGGLSMYEDHMPFFSIYEGFENSTSIQGVFTGVSGTVYFLVDNVNGTGARATGDVTVRVTLAPEAPEPISWIVLATCGLGFGAAIAIGVGLAVRNRRRRLTPATPLPLMPPPPPPP